MTTHQATRPGRFYWLRRFNKAVFNRIIMTFAGRRVFAVVHHVGRRSGRLYQTPVIARPVENGFVMALTYGPDTDWCLNVMAAGRCAIELGGVTYEVTEPEFIGMEAGLPAFPRALQGVLRMNKIDQYVRVKRVSENEPGIPA